MKGVFNYYCKMPLPLKVTFWFFVCSIIQKGLAFFSTPIFTRLLSTSDFGLVSVYYSWNQILSIFVTLGLVHSVSNVGLVKFENDKDGFQTAMLGLSFISFIIFLIILLTTYKYTKPIFQMDYEYICILPIDCFFVSCFGMWTLRERFEYRYKYMSIATILNATLAVFIPISLVYLLEDKAFGRIIGVVLCGSIFCLFSIACIIKRNKKWINLDYWRFALKYNIPIIPHLLSLVVLNQIDRIMIQYYCGLEKAGIYSIAYNSAAVVLILNQALTASYNPWFLQRLKSKYYDGVKDITNLIQIIYIVILVLLVLFAPEIMNFMAPAEYYEGVYIIPSVASSMFFILLFNLFAPIEYFSLNTKFIGAASVIAAIVNIFLNVIFIKRFGYVAAGYTTLICYIIYAFVHYIYMLKCSKEIGCGMLFDKKRIAILSLAVVLLSVLLLATYSIGIIRFLVALVILIVGIIFRKKVLRVYGALQSK